MKVLIIGAGIGGLVAALLLASAGCHVTVVEAAATPGGKLRQVAVGADSVDAGPTVFTMRPVFEAIFAEAGLNLADHLTLSPLDVLAHHRWEDGSSLDLFADEARSAAAIGDFAGPAAARGYRDFARRSGQVYETLDASFMQAAQPGLLGLIRSSPPGLFGISPFATLWGELGRYFTDPRLRQLFGRYATYCGASPFAAPATLMLIAHAEQLGVWRVAGGMIQLARVLAALAQQRGARFLYGHRVAEILVRNGAAAGVRLADGQALDADAVIANADVTALATGLFGAAAQRAVAGAMKGAAPSLSALTWAISGSASGAALAHHNVFFSADYAAEFAALDQGRLPPDPTVYLCAPDGNGFLCLVNAAAGTNPSNRDIEQWLSLTQRKLARCGTHLTINQVKMTGPAEFAALFPATGGALYGRSLRSWRDPFARPGAATRLPGLYLAGGSVHPGPGVPMAATSGRIAARCVLTGRSRRVVTPGGMSTRSAMTTSTPAR